MLRRHVRPPLPLLPPSRQPDPSLTLSLARRWESALFQTRPDMLTNVARLANAVEHRDERGARCRQVSLYLPGLGTGEETLEGALTVHSRSLHLSTNLLRRELTHADVTGRIRRRPPRPGSTSLRLPLAQLPLGRRGASPSHTFVSIFDVELTLKTPQILLFGFSRGAYVCRLLLALVDLVGILDPKVNLHLFPALFNVLCLPIVHETTRSRRNEARRAELLSQVAPFVEAQKAAQPGGFLIKVLGVFECVRDLSLGVLDAAQR